MKNDEMINQEKNYQEPAEDVDEMWREHLAQYVMIAPDEESLFEIDNHIVGSGS